VRVARRDLLRHDVNAPGARSAGKTPHQTPWQVLTEARKRANLLGSMYSRVPDASQRQPIKPLIHHAVVEEYAVLR